MRRTCTRRASLVSDRTRVKNRLHAVLHQRMMAPPVERLFCKAGLAWLKVVTLPGVDVAVAESLLSALGDISRFSDADHAASYLGLVPSTKQSADRCYHGPITKQGRSHARWMLVQAAQHIARHPGPLGVFFRRLAKRKNHNVAVVACARKLVTIAWHMLKNNEPYRYAQPKVTEGKLARLRVKSGTKRKRGPTKGQARSTKYGSGERTRRVPSIGEVYEREGLPPLAASSVGERRTVQRSGTGAYVQSIQTPQRVPRRRKADATPDTN
jgi:hypothetical protein